MKREKNLGPLSVDALIDTIPGIATVLGKMMAADALPLLVQTGLWLDRAEPTARVIFRDQASGVDYAIELSIVDIEDKHETETDEG